MNCIVWWRTWSVQVMTHTNQSVACTLCIDPRFLILTVSLADVISPTDYKITGPVYFYFYFTLFLFNKKKIMASRAFSTALRATARAAVSRPSVTIRPMSVLANTMKRTAVKSTVSKQINIYTRNATNFLFLF